MSDINSVKAQIQTLIDLANTTTGKQDTNLTDGVNSLIALCGGGEYTPTLYTYKAQEVKNSCLDKVEYPNDATAWYHWWYSRIQGSNNYHYRTFLQHDLSGIPEGATIKSAYLRMYCYRRNDNAQAGTTNVGRVTAEWSEETICWNNQPAYEGRYLAEDVSPPPVSTWTDWDITNLVTEWVNGTHPNYGIYIINNNEGSYRVDWDITSRFYKDNSALADYPDLATYIEIEYEI